MFDPKFKISEGLNEVLATIDAQRTIISQLQIGPHALASLQESTGLASTHYSTQIEGNRLSESEVKSVSQGAVFPNRNRDMIEVKNYFRALAIVSELASDTSGDLRLKDIGALNDALVEGTKKSNSYRDGQNIVRDSKDGKVVKNLQRASDAPSLEDLIIWINSSLRERAFPIPIIAALAHYQIATIHPYDEGNGHTARLLALLILRRTKYGLNGIFSLDEYYASDLQGYYNALKIDETHDFYFGRAYADLTNWIDYFCKAMRQSLSVAEKNTKAEITESPIENKKQLLRNLDRRQRRILLLFGRYRFVTTFEISELLDLHRRTSLNICNKWVKEGFLIQHGEAKKNRKYELADRWLSLI